MKKKDESTIETPSSQDKSDKEAVKRRDIVKGGLAVGGMTFMLSEWKKPVVETIVLPAHAQTTTINQIAIINI